MKKFELPVASLLAGLFLIAVSSPRALADAELQILIGSTVVYDSGDLASASGSGTYSYSSATTSFSLEYGWNNPGQANLLSLTGIDLNSTVPVTFELSGNNNLPFNGHIKLWTIATLDPGENYVGSGSTYFSANNDLLAPTELLFGYPLPNPNKNGGLGGGYAAFNVSGPYSLAEVLTLSGEVGSGDGIMNVTTYYAPDNGMTLSMLSMAFFGLFAVRNRLPFGKWQSTKFSR